MAAAITIDELKGILAGGDPPTVLDVHFLEGGILAWDAARGRHCAQSFTNGIGAFIRWTEIFA